MLFPFCYHPHSHFLLAVVLPDKYYIYFLDPLPNSDQTQLYLMMFPIFLSSYLNNTKSTDWVFTWVHNVPVHTILDRAIFVCAYMYIFMELNRQQYEFDKNYGCHYDYQSIYPA